MPKSPVWRNRIVKHAEVDPAQLLANPKNWRIHPTAQRAALKGAINDVGYTDPVEVQDGTDMVLDGHLRVALALQENQPTIPVNYLDLNDAEADEYLAIKDPISAMATADAEQLDTLLRDVSTTDAAVMQMLSDLAESAGVVPPNTFDPNAEWVGMPEFEQDDQMPVKQVIVNFATEADVENFARLIEQNVAMTTKSIWYPFQPKQNRKAFGWIQEDESDAA